MTAEKTIKTEAKHCLSQNSNWCKLIVGMMLVVIMLYLLPAYVGSFSELIPGASEQEVFDNINSPGIGTGIYLLFNVLFVSITVFVSPVCLGYKRYLAIAANGEKAEFNQLFYYFQNVKLYQEALTINLSVILRYIGVGLVSFAPYLIMSGMAYTAEHQRMWKLIGILKAISYILAVIGAVVFAYLSRKYYLVSYLYATKHIYPQNNMLTTKECLNLSKVIMKQNKNMGKAFKMLVSFIPWILACFFVLPSLYVVPYYLQSIAVSQKYIVSISQESSGFFGSFPVCYRPQ